MTGARFPRLVVFDVDGTLQDTLAWWPAFVPPALEVFAATIGEPVPVPSRATLRSVVGKAGAAIWAELLPPPLKPRWRELRDVCEPLEVERLRRGDDLLFPGTRELLATLREAGVRIALASNCRQPYLDGVLSGQGLGDFVDEARCLDSDGVATKADMVRLALESAATRDAVMVGDRDSDREAAAANGIVFLHRTGYLGPGALAAAATAATQHEVLVRLGTFPVESEDSGPPSVG